MCLRVSSPRSGRYVLWNSKIPQALHQERNEKNPKIQLPTPFKDCFSNPSLLAVFSGLNKAADFAGDQVSFEHSMEPAPPPVSADWQCHDNFSLKSLTFQLYFFSFFSKPLTTAMAWVAGVPRFPSMGSMGFCTVPISSDPTLQWQAKPLLAGALFIIAEEGYRTVTEKDSVLGTHCIGQHAALWGQKTERGPLLLQLSLLQSHLPVLVH